MLLDVIPVYGIIGQRLVETSTAVEGKTLFSIINKQKPTVNIFIFTVGFCLLINEKSVSPSTAVEVSTNL